MVLARDTSLLLGLAVVAVSLGHQPDPPSLLTRPKSAQNASVYDPINQPVFQLSPDVEQAFYIEEVLSLANNLGANTGEVLRIATQLVPGSEESTYEAFYYPAQFIHALAESIDAAVDPVGARDNYFHAATYYRGAAFFLIGNQSDPRLVSLWDQQIAAFDSAVALLRPAPAESFTVRAKNSSIGAYNVPGYFYKAESDNSKKLPTFIVVNGYDGSQQESYHTECVQILARGMNCVTYEGPGQPSPRRYQNLGFIADWWSATTPVLDYILTRSDVDPGKIVLMGESFGGTLAPRAASQEPRISAIVALDGLASLQQDLMAQFGPELDSLFTSGKVEEFNEILTALAENASLPISDRWIIQQGLYAFNTRSPFEWFTRLGEISMTPEVVKGVGQRPVYIARGQVCFRITCFFG
jgi:hypothetical protein